MVNLCSESSVLPEHLAPNDVAKFWTTPKKENWFCNRHLDSKENLQIPSEQSPPEKKVEDWLHNHEFAPANEQSIDTPHNLCSKSSMLPEYPAPNDVAKFWNTPKKVNWFCNQDLDSKENSQMPSEQSSPAQKVEDMLNIHECSPEKEQIIDSPQNVKVYATLTPAKIDKACCYEDSQSIESSPSKKVKIIQNLLINPGPSTPEQDFANIDDCTTVVSETEDDDDDDVRDKDFNIDGYSTSTSSEQSNGRHITPAESISNIEVELKGTSNPITLSEQIRETRNRKKKVVRCSFCDEDIVSLNFARHLQRRHGSEKEVNEMLQLPVKSAERRNVLQALRNETNFNLYLTGNVRPRKQSTECSENEYIPCPYCKSILLKTYLRRHAKSCPSRNVGIGDKKDIISKSHTLTACAADATETISKLNVKEQVFDLMKGDEIAHVAKGDLLIVHFGDSYLKKHKRERLVYTCSNRMRELARLLIAYRNLKNNGEITFKELLQPKNFDNVLSASRNLVGYNVFKKTFQSPSLAMHLGSSLKTACDELYHLILKESRGFRCSAPDARKEWLANVKHFKKLVEFRWNTELASLAHKDLDEKRWNKPLIIPLISDIKLFRDECIRMAEECVEKFRIKEDDVSTYKLLVNVTLALIIVFNRRRIGDVQFLKVADYKSDQRSNIKDFENVLTETEKMLTSSYKRVLNSGKGSRMVVILIPKSIEHYVDVMLEHRSRYIPEDNEYVFATPNSKIKWGKGDVAIRTLADKMQLKNPSAMSSNKLRKQIATITQILSLSKDDEKQFSKFMGHTQKTHEEFYELPADVYQTAKVSKLLLMMEKGEVPLKYKGKSLADIEFDENLEYAVENENDEPEIFVNDSEHYPIDNLDTMANPGTSLEKTQRDTPTAGSSAKNNDKEIPKNSMEMEDTTETESTDEPVKNKKKKEASVSYSKKENGTTLSKKRWSQTEIKALEKEFQSQIRKKQYPSGEEIKIFLQKTKIQRSMAVVKSKLQHLIKLKHA